MIKSQGSFVHVCNCFWSKCVFHSDCICLGGRNLKFSARGHKNKIEWQNVTAILNNRSRCAFFENFVFHTNLSNCPVSRKQSNHKHAQFFPTFFCSVKSILLAKMLKYSQWNICKHMKVHKNPHILYVRSYLYILE